MHILRSILIMKATKYDKQKSLSRIGESLFTIFASQAIQFLMELQIN